MCAGLRLLWLGTKWFAAEPQFHVERQEAALSGRCAYADKLPGAGSGLQPAGGPALQDTGPRAVPALLSAPAVLRALLLAPAPALEAAALHFGSANFAPEPAADALSERGVAPDAADLQGWQSLGSSSGAGPAPGQQDVDTQAAEASAPAVTFHAESAFWGTAAAAIALFTVGVVCGWTRCCASCCRHGPARVRAPSFSMRWMSLLGEGHDCLRCTVSRLAHVQLHAAALASRAVAHFQSTTCCLA